MADDEMMEKEEMAEFTIPRESLGEYECQAGDKLTMEVTSSDDAGISVKVVGKEKAEAPSIVEDEGLEEAFMPETKKGI